MSTPTKAPIEAAPVFSPTATFVFTPIGGASKSATTTPAASSASSVSEPFVFGTKSSGSSASVAAPSFEFNFDAPPPAGAFPAFTVGPSRSAETDAATENDEDDDGDEKKTPSKSSSSTSRTAARNPFAQEIAKRRGQAEALAEAENENEEPEDGEEQGEDDEEEYEDGEEAEEQGEDDDEEDAEEEEEDAGMDEDDEGDLPYPHHEKSSSTVTCDSCSENIPRNELALHEKYVCSETPIECVYSDYHCGATAVNRRLLRAHLERNLGDHLVWIMQQLEEQKTQIQTLNETVQYEQSRRVALEEAVKELGGIVHENHASENDRRGRGRGHTGGGGGGGWNSSSSSSARNQYSQSSSNSKHSSSSSSRGYAGGSSSSPPIRGSPNNNGKDPPLFTITFDAAPLVKSENRWTPHSLFPISASPAKPVSLAGTGNSASEEQTKLKIAAGLLPASALNTMSGMKSPPSKSALASSSPATATAATVAPGEDDLPALTKQLKSVLNKLTAANFDKLSKQVIEIIKTVHSESTLSSLVVLLFDKAVLDSFFANLYSMLASAISIAIPHIGTDTNMTFKRFLLNQCQKEFEAGTKEHAAAVATTTPSSTTDASSPTATSSAADLQLARSKQKSRLLGTIRYIGELYKQELILTQIMSHCIIHLMPHLEWKMMTDATSGGGGAVMKLDEIEIQERSDAIEALCKLLQTVGAKLDSTTPNIFDTILPRIKFASENTSIPSRMRFMLKDLLELRARHWRTREAAVVGSATVEVDPTLQQPQQGNSSSPSIRPQQAAGRGAIHTEPIVMRTPIRSSPSLTSSATPSSAAAAPRPMYIHHTSHAENSLFQAASQSSGKKGGGGGGRDRDRDNGGGRSGGGGGNSRRSGGGGGGGGRHNDDDDRRGGGGGGGGQWVRGDLLDSGGSGRKGSSGSGKQRR